MVRVREIMTKGMPQVDASATVLEASRVMNAKRASGVVVFEGDAPVGMLTERSLLRRFVRLDKRPDEVAVKDVMAPLMKIDAEASVKAAAKKMLQNGLTRLGVFDGARLIGWVTLTDIARETSKQRLIDSLSSQPESSVQDEMLCPSCRTGIMKKVTDKQGRITRWECPNCMHAE